MSSTSSLRCADVVDMLDAFALGALDTAEEREIERHVAGCASCRAQLDRANEVVGRLGFAVEAVPPPPALRARLLDEMTVVRPHDDPVAPVVSLPAAAARRNVVALPRLAAIGLALVASLLLAAVVISGVLLQRALSERDDARAAERALAYYVRGDSTVATLVPAAEATPEAAQEADQPSGSLYFAPGRPGCLVVVSGFTPSSETRHYRVWVSHNGERTRVDELEVSEDGTGSLVVWPPDEMPEYDTVGITLAPTGNEDSQDLLVATVPAGDWGWPEE